MTKAIVMLILFLISADCTPFPPRDGPTRDGSRRDGPTRDRPPPDPPRPPPDTGMSSLPQQSIACKGPDEFQSYVEKKQERPARIWLGNSGKDDKPCNAPVEKRVTDGPAWQQLEIASGVGVKLNHQGLVEHLVSRDETDLPYRVRELARKRGINLKQRGINLKR
jgi:hypothetical protein